ncbi:hypothetical protein [Streptomyces atratus]|uniref:hypothetical protein n=1 Tax=Streptomyces atratus TaxID=1893 RepID=UPI002F919C67
MNDMIRIQPTRGRRIDFARWAVAQRPKVDTVSLHEFGVPARLFVDMPEDILIGALVDGHRYVSPAEDAALGRPEPGAVLGESGPEAIIPLDPPDQVPQDVEQPGPTALPGAATPEVPETPATPDSGQSDRSDSTPDMADGGGKSSCDVCQRTFTTPRGRDAHRRQVHPEA